MMRGMFAAISGLKVNQTMLDVTAADLANVNTVGYKGSRVTFADSLAQTIRGSAGPTTATGGSNAAQVGLGTKLNSIDNLMSGGSLQTTANPLDVAIQGPGWFVVAPGDGTATPANTSWLYTRAGNFTTNDSGYLMTQDGHYVLGYPPASGGGPDTTANPTYVVIPPKSTDVSIGQDGSVSYIDQDTSSSTYGLRVTAGYLTLAKFANEAGLTRFGGSLWQSNLNSGTATTGVPGVNGYGVTIAGSLEMSNVDLASEFTSMITAQRGFQANSRVITTADEMLQDLVNMKR